MKSLQTMLLALVVLIVSILLLTTNVIYLAAFKPSEGPPASPTNPAPSPSGSAVSSPNTPPQQQQPAFSAPITPPQQQQQPIIPGLIPAPPQQQQQQPEPILPESTQEQQQEQPDQGAPMAPVAGFKAIGTVNSVISTPAVKWIATGNWSMFVGNGKVISFVTNMTWYNNNGTGSHTHEFLKFVPVGGNVTLGSNNSLHVNGFMEVGTNQRTAWNNVHSLIDIKGGKTISISVDDKETNDHFAGQAIYGVVTSLIRCSDEPGPDMEVLPPCTSS
jgi:hypothetical protein